MSAMHHYPFHVGDYRAATAHLTNEQDLAYRRLLDMYYDTEAPIPLETQWVARRLRLETEVVEFVLDDMFEHTNDGWRNARCDDELARYHALVDRNRANGKAGGRPRSVKKPKANQAAEKDGNPVGSQSEPTLVLGSRFLGTGSSSQKAASLKPDDVTEETWNDWVAHRRAKKAKVTAGVLKSAKKRADQEGLTMEDLLSEWTLSGHTGCFVKGDKIGANGRPAARTSQLHIPNMPIGHATCGCAGCVSFRQRKETAQ